MTWFQFLSFFLAMLAVGCVAADKFLAPVIDRIAEERDEE